MTKMSSIFFQEAVDEKEKKLCGSKQRENLSKIF